MKARLNITKKKKKKRNVKYLAEDQNTSITEIKKTYFKSIVKKKKKKQSLTSLIESLPKRKLYKNFNWKEEYMKAKKEKYGL